MAHPAPKWLDAAGDAHDSLWPGRAHRAPGRATTCAGCDVRSRAICAPLAEEELRVLERYVAPLKVGANATLVDEGGDATRVYTVVRGMLRLVRYLPDGRRHVMAFLVPGDFTGLPCGAKHENSLEAVTESELCSVDRTRLQELGRLLPQLQERLLALTCADLRRDREVQLSLGRRTPIEAIATFLLDLSRRAERFGESASMLSLPMTRGDIADHLGLTIETVSRTFTKLRQDGLIRLPANHLVELRDREALEKHAGHSDE